MRLLAYIGLAGIPVETRADHGGLHGVTVSRDTRGGIWATLSHYVRAMVGRGALAIFSIAPSLTLTSLRTLYTVYIHLPFVI